jgi:hypothetical protein
MDWAGSITFDDGRRMQCAGPRRLQREFVLSASHGAERRLQDLCSPLAVHYWIAVSGLHRDGEVGARLAAESGAPAHRVVGERIQRAVATLHELGSTLEIENAQSRSGSVRLRAYSCPLAEATAHHPEVCQVIESFLAKAVDANATECCEGEGRPRCGFDVSTTRRRVA